MRRWLPRLAAVGLCVTACAFGATGTAQTGGPHGGPHDDDGTVVARLAVASQSLQAYAVVAPIAPLPVHAAVGGVLSGLTVLPGATVAAGQRLARIRGPEVHALQLQAHGAVDSARARLSAAQRTLQTAREQLPLHLSTRQSLAVAQSAVAQASAQLANAQGQLAALQSAATLRAPTSGMVVSLAATNGERVEAGAVVLTLLTRGRLWLRALYYGEEAARVRTGMTGRFQPASGAPPVDVRVVSVSGMTAAGGETIGLEPATAADWTVGEAGTVRLEAGGPREVSVPTRALILDAGRWWVLVRTPSGDHAQAVQPGIARGWRTFIEHGLAAGQRVVVDDAYLEFHRGIARHYQPPDE